MPEFTIESNGLLEKTAIYYNGEQLRDVKEIFFNLDETGVFDAVVQYEGKDEQIYTKNVMRDYLEQVQTSPPSFTEEEARYLTRLTVDSDGDIESTIVALNGEEQFGIVSVYVHIKAPTAPKEGIFSFFGGKKEIPDHPEFKANIVYREEDGRLTTEGVF